MTYKELKSLIENNNIPENVVLMSNSGWECGATSVEVCYYSPSKNELHLVQNVLDSTRGYDEDALLCEEEKAHDWKLIT